MPGKAGSSRRRYPGPHLTGALLLSLACLGSPAGAGTPPDEPRYFVNLFYGAGKERDFSEIVTRPYTPRPTADRMAAVAVGRELGRVYESRIAFEIEGLYAYHWPRGPYHEAGLALNTRWLDFPWNRWMPTTFAVGIGPSVTTRIPPIEQDRGHRSHVLNQFNLELTLALPQAPEVALLGRVQHRSGVFGLVNGVHGGSDFATIGFKWRFGYR